MAFFCRIFGRFSGIFCPWTSYRSRILNQEYLFLKIWSLELSQDISYKIFIFDHIWGEGARGVLAYENLRQDFCARSGPIQLAVVLVTKAISIIYLPFFRLVTHSGPKEAKSGNTLHHQHDSRFEMYTDLQTIMILCTFQGYSVFSWSKKNRKNWFSTLLERIHFWASVNAYKI